MFSEYHLSILRKQLQLPRPVKLSLRLCRHLMKCFVYILRQVFLVDDVFLFLSEDIDLVLGVLEPGVAEDLDGAEALSRVDAEERVDEVGGVVRELGGGLLRLSGCRGLPVLVLLVGVRVIDVVLPVYDQMMELLHA